ncbi:MAG: hypothetical protein R6V83_07465 [Candidatus Thorarchaeota archaeon]
MSKSSKKSKKSTEPTPEDMSGVKTQSVYALVAGISLSLIFYLVVLPLVRQQGAEELPLWSLYLFFIVLGLNLGFRIASVTKQTTKTSLFALGFLGSFVIGFVLVYYSTVIGIGLEPVASLGAAFFTAFAFMKSQIVEEESYEYIVKFIAGKLTWGVLTLHVILTYTWPTLDFILSSPTSVPPETIGSFVILSIISILLFLTMTGGMEEGGWIRKGVKRIT